MTCRLDEPVKDTVGASTSSRAAWPWLGALGLGLTFFLHLARELEFPHTTYDRAISLLAFDLYPPGKNLGLYLTAIVVIPLGTLAGFGILRLIGWFRDRIDDEDSDPQGMTLHLSSVVWWLPVLSLMVVGNPGQVPIWAVVLGPIVISLVFICFSWRTSADWSHLSSVPLSLHGAVLILGSCIGVFLLALPLDGWRLTRPLLLLMGTGLMVWGVWVAAGWMVIRTGGSDSKKVMSAMACALLPLSLLAIQPLTWVRIEQNGVMVDGYSLPWSPWVLLALVLLTGGIIARWARGIWADEGQTEKLTRLFWRGFFWITVPMLLYVILFDPSIHGPIDVFHEGESLATANAILLGGHPYSDVFLIHGLVQDPGIALAAFKLGGVSVASFRMLGHILSPLSIVSAYYLGLACLTAGWSLVWILPGLVALWPRYMAPSWPMTYFHWKMIPLNLCLMCVALWTRDRRLIFAAGGGALAGLAMLTSMDVGLVALLAGGGIVGLMAVSEARSSGWASIGSLGTFIGAYVLCSLPAVIYLLRVDSLIPFLRSTGDVLSMNQHLTGLPLSDFMEVFDQSWMKFISPLATVLASLALLTAAAQRRWRYEHWIVFLLLIANVVLFARGVTKWNNMMRASYLAPLLLIVLLSRLSNMKAVRAAFAAVVVMALFVPWPGYYGEGGESMLDLVRGLGGKNHVQLDPTWVQSSIPRLKGLFLPAEQAETLDEVVDFLQDNTTENDTLWDFTDYGIIYFLADRPFPARFHTPYYTIGWDWQGEVIEGLRRHQTRYVLFRSGTDMDKIWWEVDRCLYNYRVSEFVLRNYHPIERKAGFAILERGAVTGEAPRDMLFEVDFRHIPWLWGRERWNEIRGDSSAMMEWSFCDGDPSKWSAAGDASVEYGDAGIIVTSHGDDPRLQTEGLSIDPRDVTYLLLRMRADAEGEDGEARVFWGSEAQGFSEERSAFFRIHTDGEMHDYVLRLASLPSWMWSQPLARLRLDPLDLTGEAVVESIQLVYRDEISDD